MMTLSLWWIAQDMVTILVLIAVVSVACRALRNRPAWRHALWLVVLLKFMTPPVVVWPWSLSEVMPVLPAMSNPTFGGSFTEANAPVSSIEETEWRIVTGPPHFADRAILNRVDGEQSNVSDDQNVDLAGNASLLKSSALDPLPRFYNDAAMTLVQRGLLGVWIVGGVCALAVQFRRLRRMASIVRRGSVAPRSLVNEIERTSSGMNMRSIAATVVSETVSPFLWCVGRLRLVWPTTLLSDNALNRSRGIIAHELAHVRRRDHWVAWLELAAGAVWWWNPMFWYVRSQLRESSETTCDAIALSVHEDRQEYAEMFLELSSTLETGTPSPVLGVNAGTRSSFERRITMILSDRVTGTLSISGILFAGCIAVVFLPGWSLAQSSSSSKEREQAGPPNTVNESSGGVSRITRPDDLENESISESQPTSHLAKAASAQDPQAPNENSAIRDVTGNPSQWTRLMRAAVYGHGGPVQQLLLAGHDPNVRIIDRNSRGELIGGQTALYLASERSHFHAMRELLRGGAKIARARKADGSTPLVAALTNAKDETYTVSIIKLLLDHGSDPNEPVREFGSPLHLVTARDWREAMRVLIVQGAKLDTKSPSGLTPIELAREKGLIQATALLEKYAKAFTNDDWPRARNSNEWTPTFLKMCREVAESRGTPKATPEDLIAWGPQQDGVRFGLLIPSTVVHGERLSTRLVLRNVSNEIKSKKLTLSKHATSMDALDKSRTRVRVHNVWLTGINAISPLTLKPNEQVEIAGWTVQFGVKNNVVGKAAACHVETAPGKVLIKCYHSSVPHTGEALVKVTQ